MNLQPDHGADQPQCQLPQDSMRVCVGGDGGVLHFLSPPVCLDLVSIDKSPLHTSLPTPITHSGLFS